MNCAKKMIDGANLGELETYLTASGVETLLHGVALNLNNFESEHAFNLGVLANLCKLYRNRHLNNPYGLVLQGLKTDQPKGPSYQDAQLRVLCDKFLSKVPSKLAEVPFK